jgi:glycosyltransferase involved in cell wall biosynthesis
MHFTKQDGFTTAVPSIFHPHDLQHVHLPEYFSKAEARERELRYRVLCEQATTVLVNSEWVRNDVIEHFGLSPSKVHVLSLAAFFAALPMAPSELVTAVKVRYGLPNRFVFYPAQTWPHKNHFGLLAALRMLKVRDGLVVPLVCTGTKNAFYPEIQRRAVELGVDDQVQFLGFVETLELAALYQLATAEVVPTRFEAGSGPIWEAFAQGLPVACSNVTSLPEQVGDAALVFDPDDVEGLAAAIRALWCDPILRKTLIGRGLANIARYDREATARQFRAHYRLVGARATPEDVELLSRPPAY